MSFAVRTITHVLENASTDRAVYGVEGEDTVGEGINGLGSNGSRYTISSADPASRKRKPATIRSPNASSTSGLRGLIPIRKLPFP